MNRSLTYFAVFVNSMMAVSAFACLAFDWSDDRNRVIRLFMIFRAATYIYLIISSLYLLTDCESAHLGNYLPWALVLLTCGGTVVVVYEVSEHSGRTILLSGFGWKFAELY
eukprot:GHVL01037525.1.p1 GENE.GHVL01037525.1~~GHVL01037525.1.p1  ORF type:complete len:111 (-),score=3.54 GHVL01037525.1:713-1045(-)